MDLFGLFRNATLQEQEEIKNSLFTKENFWDPSGETPDKELFFEHCADIKKKFLFLQQNPGYLKKVQLLVILIGVLSATFSLWFLWILTGFQGDSFDYLIIPPFLLLLPIVCFRLYLLSITKKLIKLGISQKNDWLYEPKKNTDLWRVYKQNFPEIFDKGRLDMNLEEVFWGSIEKNNQQVHFTTGLFNYCYYESSGSRRGRRKVKYTEHFLAIRLPKKLSTRFLLYPNDTLSKLGNFFTKKQLDVESVEFNKLFAFKYVGSRNERAQEIMRTLSPRVQEELINLHQTKKPSFRNRNPYQKGISMLFSEQAMILSAPGLLLPKLITNFFNDMNINSEDEKQIEENIDRSITIASEIQRYLD